MKRLLAGLVLVAASGAASAETLDLNIGDDAVRGVFSGPLSRVLSGTNGVYELGGLVNSQHDDDLVQVHAGLLVTGDAGAKDANVTAGLGARFAALDAGPFTASAIEIGGQVEVRVPTVNRLSINGYLYGAPNVLTFGDADAVYEYAFAVDYQVIRNASVYVGWRQLKVDGGPETVTADTGFHFGLKLNF